MRFDLLPGRASSPRKLIIWLLTVVGIVAGLLAMHTLNLEAAPHAAETGTVVSAHVEAHDSHGAAHSEPTESAVGCFGECGPDHSTMAMACILAVLATLLLIGMRQATPSWAPLRAALERSRALLVLSLPRTAPSLHVLSISRT